jgi:U3 small nucleolar RNA-associated protein 13
LGDYKRAIQLALSLGQPGRLLSLFQNVISTRSEADQHSASGVPLLDRIIESLDGADLVKLLSYVRAWNTQAKTSAVAQTIIFGIVKLRSADNLIQAFKDSVVEKKIVEDTDSEDVKPASSSGETALKEMVEGLIPYTERHMSRMGRLLQESYVVDYILLEMDSWMLGGDDDDEDSSMDVDELR